MGVFSLIAFFWWFFFFFHSAIGRCLSQSTVEKCHYLAPTSRIAWSPSFWGRWSKSLHEENGKRILQKQTNFSICFSCLCFSVFYYKAYDPEGKPGSLSSFCLQNLKKSRRAAIFQTSCRSQMGINSDLFPKKSFSMGWKRGNITMKLWFCFKE